MHEIDPISRRIYASHVQVPGCIYMYVSYFRLSYQKVFSQLHGLAFSTLCSQFGVLRLNFLPFQIVSGGACSLGIKQHQPHISGTYVFLA